MGFFENPERAVPEKPPILANKDRRQFKIKLSKWF